MIKERAEAVLAFGEPFTITHQGRIMDFAAKRRLPTLCNWLESGDCFMSYGPNRFDMFRRAAVYVDKILKGAKPADLPVEQPMRLELVVNLKTAKRLGLTIPQSVLGRADHLIQ